MTKFRATFLSLLVALIIGSGAFAAVSTITGFTTQADGNTITASTWNTQIGQIYTYINANLVNVFNLLAAKGDLLTVNAGGTHVKVAVGANGTVLTADDTTTGGFRWGALSTVTNLTTKGDLLGYTGSANARLAAGTDGQVLVSRAAAASGVGLAWEDGGIPSGSIILWSGSIATIPSGYALCDGAVHGSTTTPNLQGLFIIGAGNVSPGASGGAGLITPGGPSGTAASGTGTGPAHTHSVSFTGQQVAAGAGPIVVGSITGTSSATVTPRYYALAYIEKL